MNVNAIQNQNFSNNNNPSFRRLRIKIKGAEFKNNPGDMKLVKEAIKNNEIIRSFFSNHNGKIVITSGKEMVPITHDYPECLKKVPGRSLPFDQFKVDTPNYYTNIECLYSRAFALRNLFRKPVHVNAVIKAPNGEVLTWKTCVNYTIRLINEKLGDAISQCEERRLKIEKP